MNDIKRTFHKNQPITIDPSTMPDVICGAKPNEQQYKTDDNFWVCDSCYEKIDPEPEILTIPNIGMHNCVKCGQNADHLVGHLGKCDSTEFTKISQYKTLSALVSPTGQDQIVEIELTKCIKCGFTKYAKVNIANVSELKHGDKQ